MAEKKKSWLAHCIEVLHVAHDLHWLWTIFPSGLGALVRAGIVAAITFSLAILQHLDVLRIWLYTLSSVVLYGVGWAAIRIALRKNEDRRSGKLTLTSYELRHTREAGQSTSIFLRARIELSGVRRSSDIKYRMELSHNGILEAPEFRDDVAQFEITDWSQSPIPHDSLRPLPRNDIRENIPVEGWVHFITTWSNDRLYRSYVRLFADASNASGSLEIRPSRESWNVVPDRMIVTKDFGSLS